MTTTHTRSALILAATLAIGMALGALLFGTIQKHRFESALRLARPHSLMTSVEEVIRPVDGEQARAVGDILKGMEAQMRQERSAAAEHRRAMIDTMQARLLPLLTAEQQARLKDHLVRHREAAGRRPPPPPPPR